MDKKKVLFVDDNLMDRMILSKALKELNLEFKGTETPEGFLSHLKEYEPDLCLVDLNISQNNDGELLVRAIRKMLGAELPIIIISALEESEAISKNIKIGANDFVCKPIDKALLSSKISNYLKTDQLSSQVLPLFKVPNNENRDCEISIDCELESISESELQILSPYPVKETINITITDPFITGIFNESKGLELNISKSWTDKSDGTFHFIGQFLNLDATKKQKIRQFITRNR